MLPRLLALLLLSAGCLPASHAGPPAPDTLPAGGVVTMGSATIAPRNGNLLTITQTSNIASYNWTSGYSIGSAAHVDYIQPSSSSIALNHISGGASQIYGKLTSNGQVFLLNPSGILFGPSASVNVGALVASSLEMSDEDILSGKLHFNDTGNSGTVINEGTLTAADGGFIALLAPEVRNSGVIKADFGTVAMAAGSALTLDFTGDKLIKLQVDQGAYNALAENSHLVQADGGSVFMSVRAADTLMGSVLNNSGIIQAKSIENRNGVIHLLGDDVLVNNGTLDVSGETASGGEIRAEARLNVQMGSLNASGANGGSIALQGVDLLQTGTLEAKGNNGNGGNITLHASSHVIQTSSAQILADSNHGQGGNIIAHGETGLFNSGILSATGMQGGNIHILGEEIKLASASLNASGDTRGGTILIGGDYQGNNPDIPNARTTLINPATSIQADARASGDGGKVIVWSEEKTTFLGDISARGGALGGNGGLIETSSKDELVFGGLASAAAPHGDKGTLLLDPKNIIISNAGLYPQYNLIDPLGGSYYFGDFAAPLGNGNIVVIDPYVTVGGNANAGAAYLYNGFTGGLISMLVGSHAEDMLGAPPLFNSPVVFLNNGNHDYVVVSSSWNNAGAGWGNAMGAVTLGSGTAGVSGIVSSANSLVGSHPTDRIGDGGLTVLPNGNYVVISPFWCNGASCSAGAVTLVDGATGRAKHDGSFIVSDQNSLVGTQTGDMVGLGASVNGGFHDASHPYIERLYRGEVVVLPNGDYVVASPRWANGSAQMAGAVTLVNGDTGAARTDGNFIVSDHNSLVGTRAFDGSGAESLLPQVYVLPTGDYVVINSTWGGVVPSLGPGAIPNNGAVTLVNGATGAAKADGNFVISASNSLVGTHGLGYMGSGGIVVLDSGDYVVISPRFRSGGGIDVGAVTLVDGVTGRAVVDDSYLVTGANSLMGTNRERVGAAGVVALPGGDYVVSSPNWHHNGGLSGYGAVTLMDGVTGRAKADAGLTINASNSLVGSAYGDFVGGTPFLGGGSTGLTGYLMWNGVQVLPNGNYLVNSPFWNNGTGAVTLVDHTTGAAKAGGFTVSSGNSLVGSNPGDYVGGSDSNGNFVGTYILANGDYVVASPNWMNGVNAFAGAVTLVDHTTGAAKADGSFVINSGNSLVGVNAENYVGSAISLLSNGNYVVGSMAGMFGPTVLTLVDGTTGAARIDSSHNVSADNSLIGGNAAGIIQLAGGNFIDGSGTWINGDTGLTYDGQLTKTPQNSVGSAGAYTSNYFGFSQLDSVNNVFVASSYDAASDSVNVTLGLTDPFDPNQMVFDRARHTGMHVTPYFVTQALDLGTNVVLQASNDITVNSDITTSAGGNGGDFTLQAGRGILLNAVITTDNGNFTAIANESLANGVADGQRDPGPATITMGAGSGIHTGAGTVTLTLNNSTDKTYNDGGDITLGNISGSQITVDNQSSGNVIVAGNINAGSGMVDVRTSLGNIYRPAVGTLSSSSLVRLNAGSGIGIGGAVHTDLHGTGALNLTSHGAGAVGNITVVEADHLDTSQVTLATDASRQMVSLTSSAPGTITINADIGNATDDLSLIAPVSDINWIAGTVTANNLILDAGLAIGANGAPIPTVATDINATSGGGDTWLSNTGPVSLTASVTSGVMDMVNSGGALTVAASGVQATSGSVTLRNATDDIILNGAVSGFDAAINGDAVRLATGTAFINNAGAGAVTANGGGRWMIYSDNPMADVFGGLASGNNALWGSAYPGIPAPGSISSGNRYLFAFQPTVNFQGGNLTKRYGQDYTVQVATRNIGWVDSGYYSSNGAGSAFIQDSYANAFSGNISVSSLGAPPTAHVVGSPYVINVAQNTLTSTNGNLTTFANGLLTVTPAPLTITANNQTKAFGQLFIFSGNEFTSSGLQNSETIGNVTLNSAGAPASAAGGSYSIIPSNATGGTFSLSDYDITYKNGVMTVNQFPPTIIPPTISPPSVPIEPVQATTTCVPEDEPDIDEEFYSARWPATSDTDDSTRTAYREDELRKRRY